MSKRRKGLLNQLNNNELRDRSRIRTEINRLTADIRRRLKVLRGETADCLAAVINNTDESRKMFEAVRQLSCTGTTEPVSVFDDSDELVFNSSDKAHLIRRYFSDHYTCPDDEVPLTPFIGTARPLNSPITSEEVKFAASKLRNGKAVGPDGIPNELLKYATSSFYDRFATLLNRCFETHEAVPSFTEGYLAPLQKPGKPKGPLKSIRPLCLLNGTWKILSVLVLHRIREYVGHYTGPWQNAYKAGHSTSNIVWA